MLFYPHFTENRNKTGRDRARLVHPSQNKRVRPQTERATVQETATATRRIEKKECPTDQGADDRMLPTRERARAEDPTRAIGVIQGGFHKFQYFIF